MENVDVKTRATEREVENVDVKMRAIERQVQNVHVQNAYHRTTG